MNFTTLKVQQVRDTFWVELIGRNHRCAGFMNNIYGTTSAVKLMDYLDP